MFQTTKLEKEEDITQIKLKINICLSPVCFKAKRINLLSALVKIKTVSFWFE